MTDENPFKRGLCVCESLSNKELQKLEEKSWKNVHEERLKKTPHLVMYKNPLPTYQVSSDLFKKKFRGNSII